MSTFLYFAYGSNLLASRVHINNPSAARKAPARLKDYRLTFDGPVSEVWRGCGATIRHAPGHEVWGAVWEVSCEDTQNLNRQESKYKSLDVVVETADQQKLTCLTYEMVATADLEDYSPSCLYKAVIVKGARESGLPEDYITELRQIKDNGYDGPANSDTIPFTLADLQD